LAFTIAEILIAVLLVTMVTVSLYAAFSSGFAMMQISREDLRATQILMQKLEGIKLCTWSSLSNCPVAFVEQYDPTGTNVGTVYSGTLVTNSPTAIPGGANYRVNMCRAVATIYWTNYSAGQFTVRTRQMETLVARYGIQNYVWGTGP
jgi:hypothetical protein